MPHRKKPTHLAASEVKNTWHDILDRVSRVREEIVVTRYGRPIMKITPLEDAAVPTFVGHLAGTVTITGDIISPAGEPWEADA